MIEGIQAMSFHGYPVRYQVVPPESQVTHRVLLLCSPALTGFHYRKLLPELAGLNCLTAVVDLPGFGRYSPRGGGVLSGMLWGVLDALDQECGGKQDFWHLIAHGAACPIILSMANRQPNSVLSQVLLSPLFPCRETARRPTAMERRLADGLAEQNAFRRLADDLNGRPLKDYVFARMWKSLSRPGAARTLLQSSSEAASMRFKGFSPVMAIWGARDPLIGERFPSELRRIYPEAETHVLKTAGHFPMETHSSALRDYLRGWIRYVQ